MHSIASCAAWKAGIGISSGVGRDQRQAAGVGEVDQGRLRRFLDRVAASRQLDVKPLGEERLKVVDIGFGLGLLTVGKKPRQRPFRSRGECDQTVAETLELGNSTCGSCSIGRSRCAAETSLQRFA